MHSSQPFASEFNPSSLLTTGQPNRAEQLSQRSDNSLATTYTGANEVQQGSGSSLAKRQCVYTQYSNTALHNQATPGRSREQPRADAARMATTASEAQLWSGSIHELCRQAGECVMQTVSCPNFENYGCPWQGAPQDRAPHYRECDANLQQLSKLLSLFPAVHRALVGTNNRESALMACGQGCGQNLSQNEMKIHYEVCPLSLISCTDCGQKVERQHLAEHSTKLCERRVVPCPYGCGMAGVFAYELRNGFHARSCSQRPMPRPCEHCHDMIAYKQLDSHKRFCNMRPVHCVWCQNSHPLEKAGEFAAECRKKHAHPVQLNGQTLQLCDRAAGPVYIAKQDSHDPVFLKLPLKRLLGADASDYEGYLITGLNFLWNGDWWKASALRKIQGNISVHLSLADPYKTSGACVQLYSECGRRLDEWTTQTNRQDANPLMVSSGNCSFYFDIQTPCLAACTGSHIFLKLGPFLG